MNFPDVARVFPREHMGIFSQQIGANSVTVRSRGTEIRLLTMFVAWQILAYRSPHKCARLRGSTYWR
jgi:hypothetical protein